MLDIVEQAWSQPAVCYDGKYYSFHNIAVTPKPYQQPCPPIRIAAASPDTYPAVGARGLPIFLNARHGSFSEFVPAIREYRAAYEAAGHDGRGRVYLRVPVYLAETDMLAREEPRESLMHFYREQTERLRNSMSRGGTRAIEGRAERLQQLESLTYDEALEGQVLIGTPEIGGRAPARLTGRARHRRHPRRAQLRRSDPACAGHERPAAPLRRGQAALQLEAAEAAAPTIAADPKTG